MKWMRRTIQAGAVQEKYNFLAPEKARPRGRRIGHVTPREQDVNEHTAEKRLARIMNCNFRHNDLLVTLTYDEDSLQALADQAQQGDDPRQAAEAELSRFFARLKYHAGKAGVRLSRYIAVTADLDGDTGEVVRCHHHLVLPAQAIRFEDGRLYAGRADVETLWGHGSVNLRTLHDQADLTPVAVYLLRQVRRVPDRAKYRAARGMEKPVIVDEELDSGMRELKAPKGAKILYRSAYEPGRPQYIRYVVPERQSRKKARQRE